MPEIKVEEETTKKKTRVLKRCRSSGGEKRSSALKRCHGEESSTGEKRTKKKIKEEKKNTTSLVLQTERNRCVYDLTSKHFFPARVDRINYRWSDKDVQFRKETFCETTEPLEIKRGLPLRKDVCSLLSNGGKIKYLVRNNGERVELSEAITGKYLIICCVFVPMLSWQREASQCRALINTYTDLKKERDDFEMVIVAKMRCSFMSEDEEEPAFNRFFTEFPCLAVPFSKKSSRDKICKLLGLGTQANQPSTSVFLILDPYQKVLQEDVRCIVLHGAASFPFTDDHMISLQSVGEELRMRLDPAYRDFRGDPGYPKPCKPLTLEELFCCDSSTPLGQCVGDKKISVSELSKSKCVALYVCYNGKFMSRLESIRKECVERECELEIVIIYQPDFSEESSYFQAVKSALEKNNISSWWVLPFRDQVCRRLYQIGWVTLQENVIIWANGGLDGEMAGVEFMYAFDYRHYPFTKNSWVEAEMSPLMSLTLESFLGENGPVKYKNKDLKVPDLKNRNILLYLGSAYSALFCRLCDQYEQIKEDYPGSEVVCLLNDPNPVSEISLPHLSGPVAIPKRVRKATLVAFGEDNKIKSLDADRRLGCINKKGVSLFKDTLRKKFLQEVFDELR